jgi:hypothetical protein
MGEFDREPILWCSRPGHNREREIVRFENGKRIIEKIPQRGHQGDYENRRIDRRCAAARWIHVVRHDGFAVRMLLTNGAAGMDPNDSWGQYQKAKARYFGWFPIGSCPLALVATGDIKASQLVDRSLIGQKACEPGSYSEATPCPHCLSEHRARIGAHADAETERYKNFQDVHEKQIDAHRADMREQTQALTTAIAAALSEQRPKVRERDAK